MLTFAATHREMTKKSKNQLQLVKTIVQRVRIWGTPGTTRNPNFLFWMHNWKWMNLIKMAGLNISLSLNRRQNSSDKKHNLILSLVLFFPFCCCFSLWSVAMASPIPLKTESFRPYTKVECIESDETWQGWRLINYLLIVFFFHPMWLLFGRHYINDVQIRHQNKNSGKKWSKLY